MLFGHQNQNDDTQQPVPDAHITPAAPPPAPISNPTSAPTAGVSQDTGTSLPTPSAHSLDSGDGPEQSVLDQPTPATHHTAPVPAIDTVNLGMPPATTPAPVDHPAPHLAGPAQNTDDLLELKQQALSQLSPLIGKLEQTPEEKFRTTMMLIQTTDNQALLQDAYHAAQAITDEKARAQALLDVVNEINYFTQQKHDA